MSKTVSAAAPLPLFFFLFSVLLVIVAVSKTDVALNAQNRTVFPK